MDKKIRVAHITELSDGQPVAAHAEGVELVVISCQGTVTVFEGHCPHQGTLLAEGTLSNGTLVCRAHGWRFDCKSGVNPDHPTVCLRSFSVAIDNGDIVVDREDILAWQRQHREPEGASPRCLAWRSLQDLPGPKALPLAGNSLQIDMKRFHLILEQWCERFGPLFTFKIGTKRMLVIAESTLINAILRNRPEGYRRLDTIEPVLREIGINGVFAAEGDNWRRQRHLVMQALDTRHLRRFFPTLVKVTQRLKTRWELAAADARPVDVQQDLMRYTVDVTTNLAFGYDMNTLEQEGGIIQQHLEKILPIISRRVFAAFPYWRYLKLPSDRALDQALVEIRKTVSDLIAHSRQRLAQDPTLARHPTNLLEAMLTARDEGDGHFSDDEIFGNAITILLAGEDTTANTLAWVMHFMTQHPGVQQRLQAEADAVLGNAEVLQAYEDARQLSYVEAVMHETMRLKPVAPILAVEPNADVELEGLHIPRGTSIILLTRPGVLQENAFPRANTFEPERWLEAQTSRHSGHHQALMPFGSGPRLCPGRSLALLEMKTALSMVCRHFNLSQVPQAGPVDERFAFAMMPTNLVLRFSPRQC